MAQHRPMLPMPCRRAYHEAGHAVAAARFGIAFDRVSVDVAPDQCSRFERLDEYCTLEPGHLPALSHVTDYITFLLAGSVAEMLGIELHDRIKERSSAQRHFRSQWYHRVWQEPEADADLAYYYILFWLQSCYSFEIPKRCKEHWQRTSRMVETPRFWWSVDQLTHRLFEKPTLTREEVMAVVDEDGEPMEAPEE